MAKFVYTYKEWKDKYPFSEKYGWIQDKYRLSWQIVPRELEEVMNGNSEQMARVHQAVLKMKKLNIDELRKLYKG